MTSTQKHRAEQILGFVNRTLKQLPNTWPKTLPNEEQAQYLVFAAMENEKDPEVIEHCNSKFKEWYNCEG